MSTSFPPVPRPGQGDPIVFLDITLGGEPLGRITIHLFNNTHPLTSENFRQYCTGEHRGRDGKPQGYKGCKFHRIIKGFMLQSGDFQNTSTPSLLGTSKTSIYNNAPFADESFTYSHSRAGLLSMANSGPDSNGSQFFITCAACTHLDGKHVVFGQVAQGIDVVRKIEAVRCVGEKPVLDVRVSECGEM